MMCIGRRKRVPFFLGRRRLPCGRAILRTTIAGMALACVAAASSQGAVIYQDNFQSASDGQSIFSNPLNWVSAGVQGGGNFVVDSTTPFGPALAVDRPVPSDFGVARHAIISPSTTPGSADIIFTSTLYVPANAPNDAWVGLNKSSIGPFNNSGAFAGAGNVGPNPILAFDFRGVGAVEWDFTPSESAPLLDKFITATIDININANTITGILTDGTTSLTYTASGGLDFSGFDNVGINLTANHTGALMYVGSLQVTQGVPEPSTGFLTMTGGLLSLVFVRRYRFFTRNALHGNKHICV